MHDARQRLTALVFLMAGLAGAIACTGGSTPSTTPSQSEVAVVVLPDVAVLPAEGGTARDLPDTASSVDALPADSGSPDQAVDEPGDAAPEAAAAEAANKSTAGPLTIYFIDVGQGDATLVLGPPQDGHHISMLVDGGDIFPKVEGAVAGWPRPDSGRIILAFLAEVGVTSLDYGVLTHFDGDHIGGLVTTQNSQSVFWEGDCQNTVVRRPTFPARAVVDRGDAGTSTASRRLWRTCLANEPTHVSITGPSELGYMMDLGGGYQAMVVAANGYVIDTPNQVPNVTTENEKSLAVLVSGPQGFDLLISGDLIGRAAGAEDAQVEGALGAALKARGVDVEVLKAGHHGAANTSEPTFIQAILPEVAVILTGRNTHEHPSCEGYASLGPPTVQVLLQTEAGSPEDNCPPYEAQPVVVNGSIAIEVTGDNYSISTQGQVSPVNGNPSTAVSYACTVASGCAIGVSVPIVVAGADGGGADADVEDGGGAADEAGGEDVADGGADACCRICRTSKPCGDSCIAASATCSRPPGCACAASDR